MGGDSWAVKGGRWVVGDDWWELTGLVGGDWWEVGDEERPPTALSLSSTAHCSLEETAKINSRQNVNSFFSFVKKKPQVQP